MLRMNWLPILWIIFPIGNISFAPFIGSIQPQRRPTLPEAQEKMTRPLLEVADIVRVQGDRFIHSNFRWIHGAHSESTARDCAMPYAAPGRHRNQCPRYGCRTTSYNSCLMGSFF